MALQAFWGLPVCMQIALEQLQKGERAGVRAILDLSNTLLGREEEVAQLMDALTAPDSVRLVVITGAAGEGKSRLAQELVAQLDDRVTRCRVVELCEWPVCF